MTRILNWVLGFSSVGFFFFIRKNPGGICCKDYVEAEKCQIFPKNQSILFTVLLKHSDSHTLSQTALM